MGSWDGGGVQEPGGVIVASPRAVKTTVLPAGTLVASAVVGLTMVTRSAPEAWGAGTMISGAQVDM